MLIYVQNKNKSPCVIRNFNVYVLAIVGTKTFLAKRDNYVKIYIAIQEV